MNDSNEHVEHDDWRLLAPRSEVRQEIGMLTIGENKPEHEERRPNPSSSPGFGVICDVIHNGSPILARQDLVHSKKRVVDVIEGYPNGLPVVVVLGNLAAKHLGSKYSGQESD